MAAESDLLGVMVIAAWAVHSETAKGMEYSASRYLAYLMRNPAKAIKAEVGQVWADLFFDIKAPACLPGAPGSMAGMRLQAGI